jgi:hypothetical protein
MSDHGSIESRRTEAGPVIPSGRLVMVFASSGIPEGMLVKGMLEADDIPVFVKGESLGPYRVGPVYLWVPEEFEVQARLAIAEARSAPLDPGED